MRLLFVFFLLSVNLHARVGFTLLPPSETGVVFTNLLSEDRHLTNQILLNGSGVAAGDIDGDGLCDLYFARLDGSNALYRNLGQWRFEEIAAASGIDVTGGMSTGCVLADLDGDGDLDLIVNSLGQGTRLFFNDGRGRFKFHPQVLNPGKGGMSIAVGDLDGDGYLDLYFANYRTLGLMDIPNATATFKRQGGQVIVDTLNGRPTTMPDLTNRFQVNASGGIEEQGEADAIYRNLGGTNFALLSWTGGQFMDEDGKALTAEPLDWGLAVMIRDLNLDGRPDIYVCNDFQTPDRVWMNQGSGKFRLIKPEALRKTSMFSMSVDVADINRDGFDDLFVVDMLSRRHSQRMREILDLPSGSLSRPQTGFNTLFLNRGDSTYAEIARFSGLAASEWSWSCVFIDVDLDGYEDVLVSNGMERAARDLDTAAKLKAMRAAKKMTDAEIFAARREFPRLATRNLAFRNQGGLAFDETGAAWGFDLSAVSHGMILADLDNDGDLDVVLNNLNAPASLYRNEADAQRLAVRLRSATPNTQGIGARIVVRGDAGPAQSQSMIAGGRYLSSDEPVRAFAAAGATNLNVEVFWPSGRRSETNVSASLSTVLIEEPVGVPVSPDPQPDQIPLLFEEVSDLVKFEHMETEFDEYARQPLLPRKLSHSGPGAAWYDLDGDGWDDLILGNGRGGRLGVYRNNQKGGFLELAAPTLKRPLSRDVTAVMGWRGSPGRGFVLSANSNYEDGQTVGGAVTQIDVGGTSTGDIVPMSESSTGPIALADVDGDGDLDLFVGGSVIPGKYPAPATSRLFRNEGGRLVLDPRSQKLMEGIGLVKGAVFIDLDRDKDQDLILATEWGPVRILINDQGVFTDRTREFGLDKYLGWWTGVAVGDFDADGRMDLVAGNWGLNTFPKPDLDHPLRLYHGEFDPGGGYDLIEAYHDEASWEYMPARQLGVLSRSLGFVRQAFSSNAQYSKANIERVLGKTLETARVAQANWLKSAIFLNRGDHFEMRELPVEAQLAPAFGICVSDFDGDGHDDLALAQNFFPMQPEVPRQDAGRGLILLGNGQGDFRALPGQASGVIVYGEQRGLAAGDFDRDGRQDLVLMENSGPAHLFRNALASPAMRVSLEGASANPDAIGASLRFRSGGYTSPLREIHSSSGWFSQSSLVQLITAPGEGEIEIRWPDGLVEKIKIPAGVKQVRLRRNAEKPAPK